MATSERILEVCVDSVASALNAFSGGAHRIELCAALSEGGLTPDLGTFVQLKAKVRNAIKHCRNIIFLTVALPFQIPPNSMQIFVMLRPRRGTDFRYSEDEMLSILWSIECFKKHGSDGFVFGGLTGVDHEIDVENCARVVQAALPLPVTFHRAFDVLQGDPESHLQTLIDLGFKRLLTSGRKKNAEAGLENICRWSDKYGGRITIMPGAGVNIGNLAKIMQQSGCREFHSSCREVGEIPLNPIIGDLTRAPVTDLKSVQSLVAVLRDPQSSSSSKE